jgi:hypothetical protein
VGGVEAEDQQAAQHTGGRLPGQGPVELLYGGQVGAFQGRGVGRRHLFGGRETQFGNRMSTRVQLIERAQQPGRIARHRLGRDLVLFRRHAGQQQMEMLANADGRVGIETIAQRVPQIAGSPEMDAAHAAFLFEQHSLEGLRIRPGGGQHRPRHIAGEGSLGRPPEPRPRHLAPAIGEGQAKVKMDRCGHEVTCSTFRLSVAVLFAQRWRGMSDFGFRMSDGLRPSVP